MLRRKLNRILWWTTAVVAAAFAVFLTAAQLLFPKVQDYRAELESWASGVLGQPLRIGTLETRWRYFSPEMVLRDVALLQAQDLSQLQTLDQVVIRIDMYELLVRWRLDFSQLIVVLDDVAVQRDLKSRFRLPELQPRAPAAEEAGGDEDFMRWLLRQGRLKIAVRKLHWIDEPTGETYQFSNVEFDLSNDGESHLLAGDIELPERIGKSLRVRAEIEGDPLHGGDWEGRIYLAGKGLSVPYLLAGRQYQGAGVGAGALDVELWSEWEKSRPARLRGRVDLAGAQLIRANEPALAVDRLQTWLDWRALDRGWQLDLRDLKLQRGGRAWPTASGGVRYFRDAAGQRLIAVRGEHLLIDEAAELLLFSHVLPDEWRQQLMELAPHGEVAKLELVIDDQAGIGGYAEVTGLGLAPRGRFPGVKNLSGVVALDQHGGYAEIRSQQTQLYWPDLFREPLLLDRFTGRVDWRRREDGLHVDSERIELANADIQTVSRFSLIFPPQGSPWLDIGARFQQGDGSKISHYLPVGVMGEHVVDWLDQGIVAGRVNQGALVYFGRPRDFPFAHGEGRFEVAFDVDDAVIVPQTGWPRIEDISANVRFVGTAMEIEATHGRIYDSRVGRTEVGIADMRASPALLTVDGSVQGATADKVRYLRESPLQESFDYLDLFEYAGASQLRLSLGIPLAAGSHTEVNAAIKFLDNQVRIKPVNLPIEEVSGELIIEDGQVRSDDITAMLYGHPVFAQVARVEHEGRHATVLDAWGQVDGAALSEYFQHPLAKTHLSGLAPWHTQLYIPAHAAPAEAVTLSVTSSLEGLGVDLDAPLGKRPEEARPLVVLSEFHHEKSPRVQIDYGDAISARLALEPEGKLRGAIAFGAGTPAWPEAPGIALTGALPALSLSKWQALLRPGAASTLDLLSTVDLRLGRLEVFGQDFTDLQVRAVRQPGHWAAAVESRELTGKIRLPEDTAREPVVMELAHWRLAKMRTGASADTGNSLDPGKAPALKITSERFEYGDLSLGRLILHTRKAGQAYHIDRMELTPRDTQIAVQGAWQAVNGTERTDLTISVDTKDVGNALSAFGFADTVKDGKGQMRIRAGWQGNPVQFSLGKLNGDVDVAWKKGRLLDIEPGAAGRIFGLLSLHALPRRLTLDFSDMFSKGFTFDEIGGRYRIVDGIATTDDFVVQTPAARIDLAGTVDLKNRLYDQRAVVTPYVTQNLPILGALAISPQIGAVILFAQRVFKKEFEKIVQFKYTITGQWDDPDVVQQEATGPAQQNQLRENVTP
ncbi:MAG: YhdP family protein [Pseudomonadota bacterium]